MSNNMSDNNMSDVEKDQDPPASHHEQADRPSQDMSDVDLKAEQQSIGGKSKHEKRLILKQDLSVVLLLAGCFWFAYLDRGAIGNARVMGYQKDIGFSNSQFYNCLMMFYVGYMVFEFPAALSLKYAPPNWLYGSAITLFGILACLMACTYSYAGVMVIRVFVGAGEAYVQTGNVFLSLWYKREELTTRVAFYFITAPIAGAASGLIAYGVQKNLDGNLGKTGWQWFFIIEGVLTIFWGLLVAIFLPKTPETVAAKGSFLFRKEEDRSLILQRTKEARNTPNEKFNLSQAWMALKDPKTLCTAVIVGATALNIAAFGAFLPTFINQFGFSPLDSQLYSIIPYAVGTITLAVVSIAADKMKQRYWPIVICCSVTCIGYILLLSTGEKVVSMIGCCFVSAGAYPGLIVATSWIMNNNAGYTKRCTAWAIGHIFIQVYSIIATQIYTTPPRYFTGHGVVLGLNVLAIVGATANYLIMKRANAKRDQKAAEFAAAGMTDPDAEKSIEELCDFHPTFRYQL